MKGFPTKPELAGTKYAGFPSALGLGTGRVGGERRRFAAFGAERSTALGGERRTRRTGRRAANTPHWAVGGQKRPVMGERCCAAFATVAAAMRFSKAAARNVRLGRHNHLPLPFCPRPHTPFVGVRVQPQCSPLLPRPSTRGCPNPVFLMFVFPFIPLVARTSQALDAQPANQGRIN